MIPKEILQSSSIKPYTEIAFVGELDFANGYVVGVTEYCMKLFLDAPSPHFMSTFIFFYLQNIEQENPVTCSAFSRTLSVHPGQGRVIAGYLRGDKTINALLLPLNTTQEEIDFLKEISFNFAEFNEEVFKYKNINHTGISTKHFRNYFYPTDIRLDYEAKKQALLDEKLGHLYPVKFKFDFRDSIFLGGDKDIKTTVHCANPQGLFEFLAFNADGKFAQSENYKVL